MVGRGGAWQVVVEVVVEVVEVVEVVVVVVVVVVIVVVPVVVVVVVVVFVVVVVGGGGGISISSSSSRSEGCRGEQTIVQELTISQLPGTPPTGFYGRESPRAPRGSHNNL